MTIAKQLHKIQIRKKIKRLRERQGVSLDALAENTQVHREYLLKLEEDHSIRPSIETLFKIAEALDTTIAELLGCQPRINLIGNGKQ